MLIEQYNEVQEKYAPALKIKTSEDFDNLIEEIKKKSLLGMSLNSYTLRELVVYMTQRITKLQKDNGTTSSQSKPEKETSKKN
jgi:CO dehydrogenase/acetyl-CoA synthase alpha subunit